jgi:hypothetical protein
MPVTKAFVRDVDIIDMLWAISRTISGYFIISSDLDLEILT